VIFDSSKVHDLFEVHTSTKLIDILKLLLEKKIHSVPVYTEGPKGRKEYVSILSIWEVMTFLVFTAYDGESDKVTVSAEALANHKLDTEATAKDLIGLEEESKKLWFYEPTTPIGAVMEAMSKGVHRVLTTQKSDETGKDIMVLVSQTDVLRWLKKQVDAGHFNDLAEKRAEDLNLVNPLGSLVVTVQADTPAIEAFLVMVQKDLHAVGVVEGEEGRLVANLSMMDLKGIAVPGIHEEDVVSADFSLFAKPVKEYLKSQNEGKLVHPISVPSREHLEAIMDRITIAHVHRVWVSNAAEEPIGIITLTDIIHTFYKNYVL
jgi:CBS domain-containing protein